ncbi:DUF1127 domain-containing protein [Sulfitobacter sp. LCG007]
MAFPATANSAAVTGNPFGVLRRIFASIGRGIMVVAESNSRLREVQALQAKSDDDLARLGIKRDEIVHRVFSDLYYL